MVIGREDSLKKFCNFVDCLRGFSRNRDSQPDLQTQVTLRSSQCRARPAIANQDSTYSTGSNPVSMVTLVPITLPCT
jgi:hypothetical protein